MHVLKEEHRCRVHITHLSVPECQLPGLMHSLGVAAPMQACANGTVTYLGNCSDSSVQPGQLYYAITEGAVSVLSFPRPSCAVRATLPSACLQLSDCCRCLHPSLLLNSPSRSQHTHLMPIDQFCIHPCAASLQDAFECFEATA